MYILSLYNLSLMGPYSIWKSVSKDMDLCTQKTFMSDLRRKEGRPGLQVAFHPWLHFYSWNGTFILGYHAIDDFLEMEESCLWDSNTLSFWKVIFSYIKCREVWNPKFKLILLHINDIFVVNNWVVFTTAH